MKLGTVVSWNDDKGYGFIRPTKSAPNSKDVFVHVSALYHKPHGLRVGDEVSFDVTVTAKGERAADVRILRRKEEGPTVARFPSRD